MKAKGYRDETLKHGEWSVQISGRNEPPEGKPRVLARFLIEHWSGCPDKKRGVEALSELIDLNPGYLLAWRMVDTRPKVVWSDETKQKVRAQRRKKRLEKKFPLFQSHPEILDEAKIHI